MKPVEKSLGNNRLDHVDFGEVYETTYKIGKILKFGVEQTDPLILDDTCTVEVEGAEYEDVPIFYHCKKLCFVEGSGVQRDNGALKFGALAFEVYCEKDEPPPDTFGFGFLLPQGPDLSGLSDMEVVVMMDKGQRPAYVIGHADHRPKHCLDIIKFHLQSWFAVSGQADMHFSCTKGNIYCGAGEQCAGPNGEDLKVTKEARRIHGDAEHNFGLVIWYRGDWLFCLGARMFLLEVYAVGLPHPLTRVIRISAAPYSKELEKATIEAGEDKQAVWCGWGHLPSSFGYSGFQTQTQFTRNLERIFIEYFAAPAFHPRWVNCRFYAQEF